MKVFFRRIHLYLSLAAGLVILSCCLTGAVLVFEKELQMAFNKDRYFVEPGSSRLSADSLLRSVKAAFPEAKVGGLKLYEAANRSAEVAISFPSKKGAKAEGPKPVDAVGGRGEKPAEAKGRPAQRQPGFSVFVNPYSGAILEKYSYRETFFYQVFALHRWLLGGEGSVGKYIVGVSTFVFLFILLTGIVLWWPKTRRVLAQRLRIKRNAGWKRLNHDMHLVFGFYSAIFLFIFAFTGLAWSFEWFNNGIYKVTASSPKPPATPKSVFVANAPRIPAEQALKAARAVYAGAEFYNLSLPRDSAEAMIVTALGANASHESATDAVYLDQYSGQVLGKLPYSERSLGARVRSTFKPVHTGSIWGTPSKILALVVCLLGVTFPITGIVMWLNRTAGKKRVAEKASRGSETNKVA